MPIDRNDVENIEGLGPSDLLEGEQGDRMLRVKLADNNQDPFGNIFSAEYTPIIERKPLPGISLQRDRVVPEGGSVSVVNGEIEIDGTVQSTSLYTIKRGRYIPGLYGLGGIGVRCADFSTGSYEYGYGDDNGNRAGIEWSGGTPYTFVESLGSRYYRKPRSEWLDPLDGTGPSGRTLNPNYHTLRMLIGWYGHLPINFFIAVSDRELGEKLVLIDRADVPTDSVTLEQPDLPIFAEANGGTLYVGGRQFGVYGRYRPEYRLTSGSGSITGAGTAAFEPVMSFRIKSAAQWHGVPALVASLTALATSNTEIGIFIGGTLTGASWGAVPDIDATETALELDTSATAISGGYLAFGDKAAGGTGASYSARGVDFPDIDVPVGEPVTLAVKGISASTDVEAELRMREEW